MSDLSATSIDMQSAREGDENQENIPLIVVPHDPNEEQNSVVLNSSIECCKNFSSTVVERTEKNYLLLDTSNILIPKENCSEEDIASEITSTKVNTDKLCTNYVYQILNRTYDGNFQIASYKYESFEENRINLLESKKTTYFRKSKVAKLIVHHEFYRTNSLDISSERLLNLAKLASQVFSNILPESFYCKATDSSSAKGALQSAYGKQRERELAIGRLAPRRKRKRDDEESDVESLKVLQAQVNIIDEEYTKLWSVTGAAEKQNLYCKKELKEILQILPNLCHPLGFLLIQADFKAYYGKPDGIFMKKFTAVVPKLITIAKAKRDPEIKEILLNNRTFNSEEHQRTVGLVLLPYLFKRTAKITARSKTSTPWTPTYKEVLNSFIIHVKTNESFQEILKEEEKKLLDLYNNHKLIIRPFVVIKGPSLSEIESAFVISGSIKYQVASVSSAVDICFQLQKVLHEPYSVISNHIWQFLEKKIYEFQVVSLYAGVTNLIEKLS